MTTTDEESVLTFGYIPTLGPGRGTLMPRTGGVPGVTYFQVCTHNIVKARRAGLGAVRDAEPYVISGPGGEAEVTLMCEGEPIKNASSMGGSQVCKLDREIFTLTGFEDPDGEVDEAGAEPEGTEGPSEGLEGLEGIQARQPSV